MSKIFEKGVIHDLLIESRIFAALTGFTRVFDKKLRLGDGGS